MSDANGAAEKLQRTGDNCLLTPEWVLEIVRKIVGDPIPLDPCTASWNPTKAKRLACLETAGPAVGVSYHIDGINTPWYPGTFWNPPFGALKRGQPSQCYAWAAKAREEARRGNWSVGLLPCDTGRQSSMAWHEHVLCPELALYCVLRGRVAFDRDGGGYRIVKGGGKAPTYSTGLYLYCDDNSSTPMPIIRGRFIRACAPHGAVMGPRIWA